jgi:hypothetical protein
MGSKLIAKSLESSVKPPGSIDFKFTWTVTVEPTAAALVTGSR